jgi:hypothetical protein
MIGTLILASLLFLGPGTSIVQELRVLHIKVVLVDAQKRATPVSRHALLISDNPASAPPRKVVTALDGTVDVKLRPGSYIVESDRPVTFNGKAYQWTQTVSIDAGRDAVLELTNDNAEGGDSTTPVESDASSVLTQWQHTVVGLWTPTAHLSGFVVDPKGLIATNQRGVGSATSVEVQLTPSVKVAGRILAADPARDVAVLWIDPGSLFSARPLSLPCPPGATSAPGTGEKIFALGSPLREQKGVTSGSVSQVEPHAIVSDLLLATGSAGGPVFTADGRVVGLTSIGEGKDERETDASRVVRIEDACEVIASARQKMAGAPTPDGTHLPVEPPRSFPAGALEEASKRPAADQNPYQMSSSDFDVAFLTPVQIYRAQRQRTTSAPATEAQQAFERALTDFSNWSEYVAQVPPVLLIRVTPKLVEGFWTTVARGAARTQGVVLPPIKRFKAGFAQMRVFCGDTEVTPIHPFKLEQRVSDDGEAIYEGLYVYEADAITPRCKSARIVLYSEKAGQKGDSRSVDPKVLEQIWQDFAPYRASGR